LKKGVCEGAYFSKEEKSPKNRGVDIVKGRAGVGEAKKTK